MARTLDGVLACELVSQQHEHADLAGRFIREHVERVCRGEVAAN